MILDDFSQLLHGFDMYEFVWPRWRCRSWLRFWRHINRTLQGFGFDLCFLLEAGTSQSELWELPDLWSWDDWWVFFCVQYVPFYYKGIDICWSVFECTLMLRKFASMLRKFWLHFSERLGANGMQGCIHSLWSHASLRLWRSMAALDTFFGCSRTCTPGFPMLSLRLAELCTTHSFGSIGLGAVKS